MVSNSRDRITYLNRNDVENRHFRRLYYGCQLLAEKAPSNINAIYSKSSGVQFCR